MYGHARGRGRPARIQRCPDDSAVIPEGGQGNFSWRICFSSISFISNSFLPEMTEFGVKPTPKLGFLGAGEEIFQGFRAGNFNGFSVNDDLAFQHDPGKHHADLRIFFNVTGLVAAVARRNKARPVKIFEQHGAQGGPALRRSAVAREKRCPEYPLSGPVQTRFGIVQRDFPPGLSCAASSFEVFFSEIRQVHDVGNDEGLFYAEIQPQIQEGAEWVT